jgi:hypothetical protein
VKIVEQRKNIEIVHVCYSYVHIHWCLIILSVKPSCCAHDVAIFKWPTIDHGTYIAFCNTTFPLSSYKSCFRLLSGASWLSNVNDFLSVKQRIAIGGCEQNMRSLLSISINSLKRLYFDDCCCSSNKSKTAVIWIQLFVFPKICVAVVCPLTWWIDLIVCKNSKHTKVCTTVLWNWKRKSCNN